MERRGKSRKERYTIGKVGIKKSIDTISLSLSFMIIIYMKQLD